MSNISPNYIITLFIFWMLLYWTVDSFNWFIDKQWTKMEITPESINNTRKGRYWVYSIVGVVLLVLVVLAWLI